MSGNNLTVDLMLKEPTRINAYLSDIALKGYFAERIFANGGGVSGGSLVYTQLVANGLFPARGGQKVAPGAEFPEVTFDRPEPKTAQVEKFGGKFRVTDEAKDRNDLSQIQSEGIKLGNDVQRWLHARALAELEAGITAVGSDVQITGRAVRLTTALTISTENKAALPAADLAEIRKLIWSTSLAATTTCWCSTRRSSQTCRSSTATPRRGCRPKGSRWRCPTWSPPVPRTVQEGTVGQVRYEQALKTVTYRDDSTESTIVQERRSGRCSP